MQVCFRGSYVVYSSTNVKCFFVGLMLVVLPQVVMLRLDLCNYNNTLMHLGYYLIT